MGLVGKQAPLYLSPDPLPVPSLALHTLITSQSSISKCEKPCLQNAKEPTRYRVYF